MAMTLFNPTKEDFTTQYGGTTFIIPAYPKEGHMVRVDDNKGNFILNQLGPRGLTSLDYGDEGDAKKRKAEDGIRRNIEFKRMQIARYNRDNEARKARHLEYVSPPSFITEWSKELGVGLIAPYEVSDVKNEEIAKLREETAKKDSQIDKLTNQVQELLQLVQKSIPVLQKAKEETEDEKAKFDIKKLNRNQLKSFVEDIGQQGYGSYSIEIQNFIRERWEGFFNKEEAAFPY